MCVPQRNMYSEERVILFLKMVPDVEFSKEVVQRVRQAIRKELSARHVPEVILETKDIPVSIMFILNLEFELKICSLKIWEKKFEKLNICIS